MSDDKIHIRRSSFADTRTCDYTQVSEAQLLEASRQHIGDIAKAMTFFKDLVDASINLHDHDKISDIKSFHEDFLTGFKQTGWWDRHRRVNRHHLLVADGIPSDVNLIDVLDLIADCVMAGMGRSGQVREFNIDPEVLMTAYKNTVELLKNQVVVDD